MIRPLTLLIVVLLWLIIGLFAYAAFRCGA